MTQDYNTPSARPRRMDKYRENAESAFEQDARRPSFPEDNMPQMPPARAPIQENVPLARQRAGGAVPPVSQTTRMMAARPGEAPLAASGVTPPDRNAGKQENMPQGSSPRVRYAPPPAERGQRPDTAYTEDGLPRRQRAPVYADSDRGAPQLPPDDEYDDEPRKWPLFAALAVIAVLMLVVVVYFFFPSKGEGALAAVRRPVAAVVDGVFGIKKAVPPKIIKFDAAEPNNVTGVQTVFTITTDTAVEGVKLQDGDGREISGVPMSKDAPGNMLWTVTVLFDEPFTGEVFANVLKDSTWYFEGKSVTVNISDPTPPPVETPLPAGTLMPLFSPPPAQQSPDATPSVSFIVPAGSAVPDALATESARGELAFAAPNDTTAMQTAPPNMAPVMVIGGDGLTDNLPDSTGDAGFLSDSDDADIGDGADMASGNNGADSADADGLTDDDDAAEDNGVPTPDNKDGGAMPEPAAQSNARSAAPAATPLPALTVQADDKAAPKNLKYVDAAYKGAKKQSKYTREAPLNMMGEGSYASYAGGVFTFRGDAFRRNAAFGVSPLVKKELSVLWEAEMGSLRLAGGKKVYGAGWTGQPAIVKWSKELREAMNIKAEKKSVSPLKEVILGGQDGKVYFLDLNDGLATRDPISVGYPLKSSVSVDPQGKPVVAFGQGVSKLAGKTGDIGFYVYSLLDQKKLAFVNGRKTTKQTQYATNGAFDGSALFDRTSDTMVIAGENGLLYTMLMKTDFDYSNPEKMKLTVSPETVYQKSKGKQRDANVGMEASAAMYKNYAFLADKHGIVRCVDTTDLKTLWVFDAGDNTDATPALDLGADGSLSLYTGTTVFERSKKQKTAYIRSLDALSGAENWVYTIAASYDKEERGGVKASPVVGENAISGLVIFTVNMTENGGSTVVALDKATGKEQWKAQLTNKTISSPVAVYDSQGNACLIQCDESGRLTMLDGLTGQIVNTLELGGKIEASPAVYNDVLVVATSSENPKVYGIRIE